VFLFAFRTFFWLVGIPTSIFLEPLLSNTITHEFLLVIAIVDLLIHYNKGTFSTGMAHGADGLLIRRRPKVGAVAIWADQASPPKGPSA
jgi:hypothetical protein